MFQIILCFKNDFYCILKVTTQMQIKHEISLTQKLLQWNGVTYESMSTIFILQRKHALQLLFICAFVRHCKENIYQLFTIDRKKDKAVK